MKPIGLLYVPDALAMIVLMAVLWYLRRQSGAKDVLSWMLGLSFILLEALASDLYRVNVEPRALLHTVALAGYVLAGITFAWVALRKRTTKRGYTCFCLSGGIPLLVLATFYSYGVHAMGAYLAVVITGIVAQGVCMVFFVQGIRHSLYAALLQLLGWMPLIWMALRGQPRAVVYWGLGSFYLLVAAAMTQMRERSRIGGVIVASGFLVCSLCLFVHPYQLTNSLAAQLTDQVWTMQKFFVTIGLLLVLLDEARQHNQELALYDELTSLPNRRLLMDRMQQAVERTNRYGTPFAVFVVDLDNFKVINDRQGHAQGDAVLRAAALRLLSVVRSSDTLARCGGDEFMVVVNEIADPAKCEFLAEQFRIALCQTTAGQIPEIYGSVGFALYPLDADDGDELQKIADRRMYQQKSNKRTNSGMRRIAVAS